MRVREKGAKDGELMGRDGTRVKGEKESCREE